tara:strand:+ start:9994 stop:10953 length:960 start_codon:yes stop_codon:yes gene_type:complete
MEKIIVTGSSGFIGMHLCKSLLEDGYKICGIDNMNNYYDLKLKKSRLELLSSYKNFTFKKIDISNTEAIESTFKEVKPNKVVNLAAQAGVRYSIENPQEYIKSNVLGFTNIIESCKNNKVSGLIYASSSSIYGGNGKIPFSIDDRVDKPISMYAVSKKSNELTAYTYNHLFGLNTTGLRFFTVYGPWGRPDMAMYIFANKLMQGEEISVFNNGEMYRDFSYIDDIVNGIRSSIEHNYPYELFNLGNNRCENLLDMIGFIEEGLGKKAEIKYTGMQLGDIKKTYANIDHAKKKLNYDPKVSIKEGIPKFLDWYKSYHNLK